MAVHMGKFDQKPQHLLPWAVLIIFRTSSPCAERYGTFSFTCLDATAVVGIARAVSCFGR